MTTDLTDNVFMASCSDQIPPGCCLIMRGVDLLFFGPIKASSPVSGSVMYLHPVDFDHLQKRMQKHAN